MAVKYTTATLVKDHFHDFGVGLSDAEIEEMINQNEAFVDAIVLKPLGTSFTFSATKWGHQLIRQMVIHLTILDVLQTNISKMTMEQLYLKANMSLMKYEQARNFLEGQPGTIKFIGDQ